MRVRKLGHKKWKYPESIQFWIYTPTNTSCATKVTIAERLEIDSYLYVQTHRSKTPFGTVEIRCHFTWNYL